MGSILFPIAMQAGIHPIHFSIIGVVSLAFGLVTPPYGMCLLIASRIGEQQVPKVLKDVGIILLPMLGILIVLALFPGIVLFLPKLITPQFL
jgi:TRAP-type C4-dicarboxylate transport system permease large subunit